MAKKSIKTINNFSESNSTTVKTNALNLQINSALSNLALPTGKENNTITVNNNGEFEYTPLWGSTMVVTTTEENILMYPGVKYILDVDVPVSVMFIATASKYIGAEIIIVNSKNTAAIEISSVTDCYVSYINWNNNHAKTKLNSKKLLVTNTDETGEGVSITMTYTGKYFSTPGNPLTAYDNFVVTGVTGLISEES